MNYLDQLLLDEMVQEDMAQILHMEEDTELIDGFIPDDYSLEEDTIDENYVPSVDDLF